MTAPSVHEGAATRPLLGFAGMWNLSFGFFGIQVAFALQGANVSRIFQTLGATIEELPFLWIAAPVTGLIVQPLVGHFSDRTWLGRLGRRRPYFLAGAILAALALVAMPHAQALWVAAALLWILDASINVSMEPFRAFVGDMLDPRQRSRGYAFQTIFIGAGAVLAACAPAILTDGFGIANTAPLGETPPSVRWAFYGGAAVLVATIAWTVVTTREFPPDTLRAFGDATGHAAPPAEAAPGWRQAAGWIAIGAAIAASVATLGLDQPLYILGFGMAAFGLAQMINRLRLSAGRDRLLNHILSDLNTMPATMRRLAIVHFLSWFGLFVLWIYATPVVTRHHFGASDVASAAYNDGANWVGVLFGAYNAVAAVYAFAIPALARRIGMRRLHAINLIAGALGLVSFALTRDADLLLVSMIGVGMAWASILTIPYTILSNCLPPNKLGVYMGLFNIFIVLPQLVVSTVMGALGSALYPDDPVFGFVIAAAFMLAAAAAVRLLAEDGTA
ncbi:MFS transporter [Sphingomonas gilva]|uniref:MFS transporter n=1 Tax=Sphingomonas gilva TaxID=2305907 RepID=A0A396RRK0_9SPHN|nr:MFS transporter [Sphingomonas gilva]RHW19297.1 MFS transporter [Sphingomonas gilva]